MKTYKRIEDTGLYVDCNKLAERLYQVRFKMPKRDRAALWEHIFKYCIDMTAFLQDAFRDKEKRIKHIDSFLHSFAKMKVILRMACEIKSISVKEHSFVFEYVLRIDEGIGRWRNSTVCSLRSTKDSNDVLRSDDKALFFCKESPTQREKILLVG